MHDSERREFFRLRCDLPVQFRFIAGHLSEAETGPPLEGRTSNISGGGVLLVGTLPKLEWVPDLLMQKIVVGIQLRLPGDADPVKGLTRVAWIETVNEEARQCRFGLRFREITTRDRDRVFQFVVNGQTSR